MQILGTLKIEWENLDYFDGMLTILIFERIFEELWKHFKVKIEELWVWTNFEDMMCAEGNLSKKKISLWNL